jgi:hypothetical protein
LNPKTGRNEPQPEIFRGRAKLSESARVQNQGAARIAEQAKIGEAFPSECLIEALNEIRAMSISNESAIICRGLDDFCLPSVLLHLGNDRFLTWNRNFLEAVACTAEELRALPVAELVAFGPTSPQEGAECDESTSPVHLDPCSVKSVDSGRMLPARAFRREDGYVFVMLDPGTGDTLAEPVASALLAGQEQERERVRNALHRTVCQQLVAAQFAAEEVKGVIQEGRSPTMAEVDRVLELLRELNDSVLALTPTR